MMTSILSTISTCPRLFVASSQQKAINDDGMPQHNRSFMKGCFYIKFNVDFPDSGFLFSDQCRLLETILPQKSN
ncbi:hypothetical protein AHAS_Ahas07G0176600 [Arachis hypogaea]